jgi:hypothetical protein
MLIFVYRELWLGRHSPTSQLEENGAKDERKRSNIHFMKKLPKDAEASNILVGEVDFLDAPVAAFIRLQHSVPLGDLTEVSLQTRFLFILLGPPGAVESYHEIGRSMASSFADEVRRAPGASGLMAPLTQGVP